MKQLWLSLLLLLICVYYSSTALAVNPVVNITARAAVSGGIDWFTITYINDHQIDFDWALTGDATNIMIRAKYGEYPANIPDTYTEPSDGYLVYYGDATSASDYLVNLEFTATPIYYKAWAQKADTNWYTNFASGSEEGISMPLIAFIILALTLTVAGFGLHSGRSILCFAATGAWVILGVFCYTRSTEEWDVYYALFWLSMGMSLIMPLTAALMRDKKEPATDPYAGLDEDERAIVEDYEANAKDEERLNLLMGRKRKQSKKSSTFAQTGISKKKK